MRSRFHHSRSDLLGRFLRRMGFGAGKLWRERSHEVNRHFEQFPDGRTADVRWIHVDITLHGPTPHDHGPRPVMLRFEFHAGSSTSDEDTVIGSRKSPIYSMRVRSAIDA